MKILVTGATGLLGRHIMERLIKTPHFLIAAVLPSEKETYQPLKGVEVVINNEIFEGTVKGIDIVINCAFSRSNNAEDLASGLDFTEKLVRGLELCKVKGVINISSQGVYKRLPVNLLSNEESPIEPMDLYSMAKYSVEKIFRLSKIPYVTNIRLASLNMKQRFLYKFVEAVKEGRPISLNSPNVYASILDVTDAATAIVQLAQVPTEKWDKTYNLGLGAQYSLEEYAQLVKNVGEILGYHPTIMIDDNGHQSTAGMDITRLNTLTGWKPIVSPEKMIEKLFMCIE